MGWAPKRKIIFQPLIFRGHVSFREGKPPNGRMLYIQIIYRMIQPSHIGIKLSHSKDPVMNQSVEYNVIQGGPLPVLSSVITPIIGVRTPSYLFIIPFIVAIYIYMVTDPPVIYLLLPQNVAHNISNILNISNISNIYNISNISNLSNI